MGEWSSLHTAPVGRPVRVWASYDPSNPNMTYRTFLAVQKTRGRWYTYAQDELRVLPSHWQELSLPPNPAEEAGAPND